MTDNQGNYHLTQITPGNYYLELKNNNESKVQKISLGSKREIIANISIPQTKLLSLSADAPKVPVILIPGIMGSTLPAVARVYPRLPFQTPTWDNSNLKLLDPFNKVGWTNLINLLKANGYVEGKTLFTVPYDWSLSTLQARDQFLIPWIEKAKQVSGSDKVDIIAHSMGGLIAREYIQSADYKNDVRKFAMVGVPNKGASAPYYIWEAGDPISADIFSGSYGFSAWPIEYFYTNTLDYFYKDRTSSHVCQFSLSKFVRYYKPTQCNQDEIYHFVHDQGHSVGELMATYDYILKDANKNVVPVKHEENRLLRALDHLPCLNMDSCLAPDNTPYLFKAPMSIFSKDASGVQTQLFMGEIPNTTPQTIFVDGKSGEKFYADGTPLPNMPAADDVGDTTVLLDSARLDPSLPAASNKPVQHGVLINAFKEELVQFITGNAQIKMPLKATHEPEKFLMISNPYIA